jgi:hypothetical protein
MSSKKAMLHAWRSRSDPGGGAGRISMWIAASLLAAGGCSDLFPPTHPYSTLDVEVLTDSGAPVPGVGLVLYDWRGDMAYGGTRFDGTYAFRFVPEGEYGVIMGVPAAYRLPDGAERYQHGIRLAGSARERVSFTLVERRGIIRVLVIDEAGDPLEGVGLVLYDDTGRSWAGVTDAVGIYATEVRIGEYGVRPVAPAGYRSVPAYVDGIVVEEGEEREVTFSLARS